MDNNTTNAANEAPQNSVTANTQPAPLSNQPRNLLAAFGLLLSFGYFGVHQLYLGNKTQGWVRFGLAVASLPLMLILVGYVIAIVLGIWTLVDFFLLAIGNKIDGEGQPLAATPRDQQYTKTLFIVTLVLGALYVILVIAAISLGIFSSLQERSRSTSPYYSPSRSY